tara:strand:- start:1237 stop:1617 length:381 start_codon:yes stop_codon:yes gene_type:complete
MALTITQTKRNNVTGTKIQAFVNITFDANYPVGGEPFDANAYVGDVDSVDIHVKAGGGGIDVGSVLFKYDYTLKSIKAFAASTQATGDAVAKADAAVAGGQSFIELGDGSGILQDVVVEAVISGGR